MNISIKYDMHNNERVEFPWREMEKQVVQDVINSRELSMFSGKYLSKAESELNSIFQGKKSLLLNSGTAALHIALKMRGIGPGDEVIVPAITYVATALAIQYVGATPVFADIDPYNFTLDPNFCEKLITKKTRAIIFVHLFGIAGNILEISHLCKNNNLTLIEDCAQAFGSEINGRKVGTFGDYACFSFFESKTISAGEGGALLVSNDNNLKIGRKYRHHGMDVLSDDRNVNVEGFNYKPSEFESALIFAQLSHYKEIIEKREKLIQILKKSLSNLFSFQYISENENPVIDKLCFIFENRQTKEKAEISSPNLRLFQFLKRPLYRERVFMGKSFLQKCPVSEYFCEHHLIFQITPYLNSENFQTSIHDFIENFNKKIL